MQNMTAFLSNKGEYTTFTAGDAVITFLTSRNLEKYLSVTKWNRGYLVVVSQNYGQEPEEDYIDLRPILRNLMIDCDSFLGKIKEVRIENV